MIRAITLTSLAFLLCALRCFGVEWPVLGYEVETNGFIPRFTVSTSPDLGSAVAVTNGNFFGGWSTNDEISRITGTNSLWMDIRCPGFNTDGTTNVTGRRIYGTKITRLPFGLGNTNDVIAENGTNVVVRVHVNSFIYTNEDVKVSSLSGWFATTNGTAFTNAAAFTSATATNGSIQPYPEVIANWVYPGNQWITNTTMRLRAMAGHLSAANGRPVECFQMVIRDEHSHIATNIATMVPDTVLFTNGLLTAIYISDFDMSSFTALDRIRCDMVVMPRFGDTNCVLNTFRDLYTGITPLPTSITNLYDPNHAYSDAIAIIDGDNGDDTNGRATNGPPTSVSSALYFKTLPRAVDEICKTNNAIYGHNDGGGGKVYFKVATNWMGSVAGRLYGVPYQGKTWLEITAYPGSSIAITSNVGANQRLSNNIAITGITIAGGTTTYLDVKELWFQGCVYSNTAATPCLSGFRTWFTGCTIPKAGSSASTGLMANASDNTYLHVIGCNLDGLDCGVNVGRTFVGNFHRTIAPTMKIVSDASGQPIPSNYGICYNNYFGGLLGANQANVDLGLVQGIAHGFLFAQNVCEIVTNAANATFNLWSLNTQHYTNIIGWNNDILGKRVAGVMYNDQGTAVAYRYQCSFKNCVWDNTGFKSDTFAAPANAARIGNWPVELQVDWEGHYYVECDNSGSDSPGSFNPEFAFNSYHPTPLSWASGVNSYTNSGKIVKFVNRQSAGSDVAPATGNGDYRLRSESPLFKLRGAWVLPYDIEGHIRSAMDPPGAYSAGNVKKGF